LVVASTPDCAFSPTQENAFERSLAAGRTAKTERHAKTTLTAVLWVKLENSRATATNDSCGLKKKLLFSPYFVPISFAAVCLVNFIPSTGEHGLRMLAKLADKPSELDHCSHPLSNTHMSEPDLLQIFKLHVLWHLKRLQDAKDDADNVLASISLIVEIVDDRVGVVPVARKALAQHALNLQRVRLVAYLEDVFLRDVGEAIMS
jgi:hypothetical protein